MFTIFTKHYANGTIRTRKYLENWARRLKNENIGKKKITNRPFLPHKNARKLKKGNVLPDACIFGNKSSANNYDFLI